MFDTGPKSFRVFRDRDDLMLGALQCLFHLLVVALQSRDFLHQELHRFHMGLFQGDQVLPQFVLHRFVVLCHPRFHRQPIPLAGVFVCCFFGLEGLSLQMHVLRQLGHVQLVLLQGGERREGLLVYQTVAYQSLRRSTYLGQRRRQFLELLLGSFLQQRHHQQIGKVAKGQ